MRQHDPIDLYILGVVHRLLELKVGHKASEYRGIAAQAISILEYFEKQPFNTQYLETAVKAAGALKTTLQPFLTADWVLEEDYHENMLRKDGIGHFESSLTIDFKALPLFLIEDKRGYSSRAFITDASVVFSNKDRELLANRTLHDLAEAGRCLLFDRHTAAGFHTMRALEAVARGYYRLVFDADPINPNSKTPLGLKAIADYLRKYKNKLDSVNKSSGELGNIIPKVDQITSIYRNDIIHPEMILDEDLAVEVFDDAKTVIATMLRDARTSGSHFKGKLAAGTKF